MINLNVFYHDSRTTVGPEFLARIHEQRTSVRAVETASNNNENHARNDCNDAEMAEDLKPTYNVMTVDVSETYYPPIDDSSKSNRSTSTYIRAWHDPFPTQLRPIPRLPQPTLAPRIVDIGLYRGFGRKTVLSNLNIPAVLMVALSTLLINSCANLDEFI